MIVNNRPNNIIFDDDIIIINSENKLNDYYENKEQYKNKENYKNKEHYEIKENNKINDLLNMNTYVDKNITELYPNLKPLDSILLDNVISSSKEDIEFIGTNKSSNRYNRKLNNIPDEKDLVNIRYFNIFKNDTTNNFDLNSTNKYNEHILKKNQDIDSKVFNKQNKSQKLFKDAKTIATRFNKNSLYNDYKYELDYYEKIKTPWWEENAIYS